MKGKQFTTSALNAEALSSRILETRQLAKLINDIPNYFISQLNKPKLCRCCYVLCEISNLKVMTSVSLVIIHLR